jgi:hypothetical protein
LHNFDVNSNRFQLARPGTKQVDFSIFKQVCFGKEGQRRVEYRAEIFNLFNTPQFNAPNATIGSTSAGQISSAGELIFFQRTSRQVQMAVKLYF